MLCSLSWAKLAELSVINFAWYWEHYNMPLHCCPPLWIFDRLCGAAALSATVSALLFSVKDRKNLCIAGLKVWVFWEGHKIWKNLRRTFDKSVVFCARNSVLVKKSTKIFQNKCGQVVLYKLYNVVEKICRGNILESALQLELIDRYQQWDVCTFYSCMQ